MSLPPGGVSNVEKHCMNPPSVDQPTAAEDWRLIEAQRFSASEMREQQAAHPAPPTPAPSGIQIIFAEGCLSTGSGGILIPLIRIFAFDTEMGAVVNSRTCHHEKSVLVSQKAMTCPSSHEHVPVEHI